MKTLGKVELERKVIDGKNGERTVYNLIIKEYDREGNVREAKIFCRLTKEMSEFIDSEMPFNRVAIEIDDSFYSVDTYRLEDKVYTKPTLVITNLHIVE